MITVVNSLEITERILRVVTEICFVVYSKTYDLYVKFSQNVAHNVQICAEVSCKIFTDVCPV